MTAQPFATVATRVGLTADVVEVYHHSFFDVCDRLHARDWLASHVLGRPAQFGLAEGDIGRILKFYAYVGGTLVLDSLLDYFRNPPLVADRPELLGTRGLPNPPGQVADSELHPGPYDFGRRSSPLKKVALIRASADQICRAVEEIEIAGGCPGPVGNRDRLRRSGGDFRWTRRRYHPGTA